MTRIAVFIVELKDGDTEVVTMPVNFGLGLITEKDMPRYSALEVLHQAVLDENPDRVKITSLVFAHKHSEHPEIEMHGPEAV